MSDRESTKIIGVVVAWGAKHWIRPCLDQALKFCDEVLLTVCPITKAMEKFEDETFNIAYEEYGKHRISKRLKIIPGFQGPTHIQTKAPLINHMLSKSEHYKKGNWVFLFDVDEYYLEADLLEILYEIIDEDNYDHVVTNEAYFMVNMQNYYKTDNVRMWKITKQGDCFVPTQRWTGTQEEPFVLPRQMGKFHFSNLCNPYAKKEFWRTEYPHDQGHKVRWIDDIYLKMNIKDQSHWIKKNKEIYGKKTLFMNSDFETNLKGVTFKYNGPWPECITKYGLHTIKDFRVLYDESLLNKST